MADPVSIVAASAVVATTTVATPVTAGGIMSSITAFFSLIPFTAATWFVLCILGFFIWLFVKANKNPKSPVNWEDLIVASETGKVSPYKLGYLVGVIVGTWIVITFSDASGALPGTSKLTFDIFATYLTFLVGGIGVAAFKKPSGLPPPPADPPADSK